MSEITAAIAYKIKVQADDFVVQEQWTLPLTEAGAFQAYQLTKSGWNTTDALHYAARHSGISYDRISYGGRKDRHATTTQLVTVEGDRPLQSPVNGFSLQYLGRSNSAMAPEYISGNAFRIVLRNIAPWQESILDENLGEVLRYGLPNYFDDQRFGAYDPKRGFLAAALLRGEIELALRIALTLRYPGEKKSARERKHILEARWGDWTACLAAAHTNLERRAFSMLLGRGKGRANVASLLSRDDLSMALSSLQSHLWNQAADRLVAANAPLSFLTAGKAGAYRFYRTLTSEAERAMQAQRLPAPGPGMGRLEAPVRQALDQALAEQKLTARHLEDATFRDVYLKSYERPLLLHPRDLKIGERMDDERYKKKRKATVEFILPRGSFGTMVIKRLTALRRAPSENPRHLRNEPEEQYNGAHN
ncbi:MAG: tRNA pseudouridine(13) synthase TruD [Leptospirales bacterium]|nr:tRNA pseudouridine(13) synthase TruD [Leptospirales bacterium]